MKHTRLPKGILARCTNASAIALPAILLSAGLFVPSCAHAQAPDTAEALLYSTMPSTNTHSPQMMMDGDENTYFKSYYDMSEGDDITVWLSKPIAVTSVRVLTGNDDGDDLVTNGYIDTSADGKTYTKAVSFNSKGIAEATLNNTMVRALRIKIPPRTGLSTLCVREITINSATKITHAQMGPGRAFSDYTGFPDLAAWAKKADQQMEDFWPDTAALLYSQGFITPNKINVIYRQGPDVTPVAATGGGVMTVNVDHVRRSPKDTGLTVHEMAHAVQSMSAYNPVWLIEAVADYIRWVRFEPQNFRYRVDPAKNTWRDPYQNGATFLGWCELHYDNRLVTHLNDDIRFGRYNDGLWKKYTGKDAETLFAEFLADYKANPTGLLTAPVAPADRPRTLPEVAPGSSKTVSLAGLFNLTGFVTDGKAFGMGGFDEGGAALPAGPLGTNVTWKNVRFDVGKPDQANVVSSRGQKIDLPRGKYGSLWILASAVEGNQMAQEFKVDYADGSTQMLAQNVSDWYVPKSFPGEGRAVKFEYRNMGDGQKDPRPFYAYSYGFALDKNKEVTSVTLPNNPNVKVLAVTVAN